MVANDCVMIYEVIIMDEIIIDIPLELLERIKAYLAGSKETVEEFIVRVLRETYQ